MPSVNDFFCGCGGMGLGFKQAGFRLAGAWDFDKYAVSSYGHNVSPKVKQDDITMMQAQHLPYADVWTFGFPCQDISVAGKQAGMIKGQTRSGLFYEVMRLLEEAEINKLPKIILAENVKVVKKYLPEIEKEYAAQGYKMYAQLYNSKYWGVPQNRERYFIVGVHESVEETFIFPEQQTEFVPKLSSILETDVDEKYYISDEKSKTIIEQAMKRVELKSIHSCVTPGRLEKRQNGRRAKAEEEEMFTLTAQDLHGVILDDTYGFDDVRVYEDVSPTLRSERQGIKVIGRLDMKGQDNIRRVYDTKGIAPTLTTSEGGHRQPKIITDMFRVRKLTPREYARLQGFPDTFEFVCSNSQMYKQFGNAVTVNVSKAIAESISDFLS